MAVFTHSKQLFTNEDGTPMCFSMPPCSEKRKLRQYIEHGGGTLTNNTKNHTDVIQLVPPGTKVSSDGYVKSAYIMDCVELNKLLSLDEYRLLEGDKYDSDQEDFACDAGNTSNFIQAPAAAYKSGRKKYLLSEDMKIINYLLEECAYDKVGGNEIWRTMECLQVTSHTWQSMRDRYMKTILPRLHIYKLKEEEKAKLTGGAAEPSVKSSFSLRKRAKYESEVKIQDEQVTGSDELDQSLLDGAPVSENVISVNGNIATRHKLQGHERKRSSLSSVGEHLSPHGCKSPQKHSLLKCSPPNQAGSTSQTKSGVESERMHGNKIDLCISSSSDYSSPDKRMSRRSSKRKCDLMNAGKEGTPIHDKTLQPERKDHQLKVLETVEEWLGLTHSEMMETLYRVNGGLDDAVHWLLHGTRLNGVPVWDPVMDELLMMETAEAKVALLKHFPEDEVRRRKVFLLQNG